jgi:hypothetical protein
MRGSELMQFRFWTRMHGWLFAGPNSNLVRSIAATGGPIFLRIRLNRPKSDRRLWMVGGDDEEKERNIVLQLASIGKKEPMIYWAIWPYFNIFYKI